jgi:site-specific recombinase XerD
MAKRKSLMDRYQDYLIGQGKSSHTVKAYGRDVGAFVQWWEQTYGQTFNPQAVTSPDIQEYRGYLVRNGSKPATINRRLIALRRFFTWLKREQQITDSPFDILEKVLVKEQRDTQSLIPSGETILLARASAAIRRLLALAW